MQRPFEAEFLDDCADRLLHSMRMIESCVARLTPEQVWWRHSENENAIGNLMLHLTGNLNQYVLSGIGGVPDTRDRPSEFAAQGGIPVEELRARLRDAAGRAADLIRNLPAERLQQPLVLPVRDANTFETIMHVVTHFYGHTYQIIYATKILTGQDLAIAGAVRGKR